MNISTIPLAIAATLMPLALGQTSTEPNQERIFKFSRVQTAPQLEEIGTAIRAVSDIKQFSFDEIQNSLAVRGTPEQLALASWLFNELDRPGDSAALEYRIPNGEDNVVRVFYLPYTKTTQQFQEALTLVRSVVSFQRLFGINGPRAAIARGTPEQIAAAVWLFDELGKPGDQGSAAAEYRMPAGNSGPEVNANVARVFHLPNTKSLEDMQDAATVIRSIADIRRLYTYVGPRIIAIRGTSEQASLVEWLVKQLDLSEPESAASEQYRIFDEGSDSCVQLFYLSASSTVADLQQLARRVRGSTGISRGFTYNARRAIVLRGTDAQVSHAGEMIASAAHGLQ